MFCKIAGLSVLLLVGQAYGASRRASGDINEKMTFVVKKAESRARAAAYLARSATKELKSATAELKKLKAAQSAYMTLGMEQKRKSMEFSAKRLAIIGDNKLSNDAKSKEVRALIVQRSAENIAYYQQRARLLTAFSK